MAFLRPNVEISCDRHPFDRREGANSLGNDAFRLHNWNVFLTVRHVAQGIVYDRIELAEESLYSLLLSDEFEALEEHITSEYDVERNGHDVFETDHERAEIIVQFPYDGVDNREIGIGFNLADGEITGAVATVDIMDDEGRIEGTEVNRYDDGEIRTDFIDLDENPIAIPRDD